MRAAAGSPAEHERRAQYDDYHDEVVAALLPFGHPASSEAIRKDRGSHLEYLAVSVPDQRRVARGPFSFYALPEAEVLTVWDEIWKRSPYGEVLFAAIEYYLPMVRKRVSPQLWPVVKHWTVRVDNWAHADALGGLYSRILEAYPAEVYPQLEAWNASDDEWLRRISLVSLIHYSGKNAVFLPLERVLPLVSNSLADKRYYLEKAVGWVLREMGHAYPDEIRSYIEEHLTDLSSIAFTRAIERRPAAERDELRRLRKGSSKA